MKKSIFLMTWLMVSTLIHAQVSHEITFPHDGLTVYGTFTVPSATGKFPTIIINPGTGMVERNGTVPFVDGNSACIYPGLFGETIHMYRELSDALVDSGYAVLRYDKIEYTYELDELGEVTFHKLWLPVESAIDYIKTRSDVDTNQIILIGHSEGSTMIPHIAKGRSDVKALISIAGPRTPFDTLAAWQYNQLYHLLEPCGATISDSIALAGIAQDLLDYFQVIRTSSWDKNTPTLGGVPPAALYDYIQVNDQVADNYNQVNLPTLFLGLALDLNVPPSELDRLQQEVTITDDFWSIPGLMHYMCDLQNADVSPLVPDTIVYWLRQLMQTGIEDKITLNDAFLQVSPNPFSHSISIQIAPASSQEVKLALYDIYGKLLFVKNIYVTQAGHDETFDLGYLSNGAYFLQVLDGNGQFVRIILKTNG